MTPTIRKTQTAKNGAGVPILHRTLTILDYLRLHPQGLTLSEISRELHFPKNTVYRILNTLSEHEYITRDNDTLHYLLSRKMATFSYGSTHDKTLIESSIDVMRRLRDAVQETVVISVIDRGEGIVLEQIQGLHSFRFVCDPGTRQLIYSSASTKAILAFLPEHECATALKNATFKRMTPNTITSRGRFLKTLEEVRRTGFGVDHAEALDGVHCVAAPILNHLGYPVAALTITGPAERVPASSFARIGLLICKHAAQISKRLGYGLNNNATKGRAVTPLTAADSDGAPSLPALRHQLNRNS
jgi:DNA-binding IclR family transcriptional regulator